MKVLESFKIFWLLADLLKICVWVYSHVGMYRYSSVARGDMFPHSTQTCTKSTKLYSALPERLPNILRFNRRFSDESTLTSLHSQRSSYFSQHHPWPYYSFDTLHGFNYIALLKKPLPFFAFLIAQIVCPHSEVWSPSGHGTRPITFHHFLLFCDIVCSFIIQNCALCFHQTRDLWPKFHPQIQILFSDGELSQLFTLWYYLSSQLPVHVSVHNSHFLIAIPDVWEVISFWIASTQVSS